jgi:hypothetical protein
VADCTKVRKREWLVACDCKKQCIVFHNVRRCDKRITLDDYVVRDNNNLAQYSIIREL